MQSSSSARVIVYNDPVNDEFSGFTRTAPRIEKGYKFLHKNIFWRLASFIVYRCIMVPVAFFYCKFKLRVKIVGRDVLRQAKKSGCFMYANHTMFSGDAFLPSVVAHPKDCYVVVNAENLSLFGTRHFLQMCGAIPIPTSHSGMKDFLNCIEKRTLQHHCVQIYPEAHIWPYYTKIRPFRSISFKYPVKYGMPSFCYTVTYQKRRRSDKPKVTVYVDGPFFPDKELNEREQTVKLHDEIFATMTKRAEMSDYEYIRYVDGREQ